MRSFSAEPLASALVESLRDIGYTLDSALADIIDNSITADAKNIRILTRTDEACVVVAVLDDGCGMSSPVLEEAMRPGSRNPLDSRDSKDLGRFGLGLKTASFSQCRKLSVLTRKSAETSAAIWDLDHVSSTNRWEVLVPDEPATVPWSDQLVGDGTLVVWEKPDRIADGKLTPEIIREVNRKFDEARGHLELVFHRFISGEPRLSKVNISFNGRPLDSLDPFWSTHPATERHPLSPEVMQVGQHKVMVQGFTLPHHKKASRADWERHAGKGGYVKNQGFYLYRAKRLILHGTWFNLARKSELTKLCRVRIEMPNALDSDWKIDVKKASAQPPRQIRQRLKNIIDAIGDSSRRVYTKRGQRLVSTTTLPVWHRHAGESGIHYSINPDHPLLVSFVRTLADESRNDFEKIMELAGSTIPYDSIFADLGRDPASLTASNIDSESLRVIATKSCRHLLSSGFDRDDVQSILRSAEPFQSNWDRIEDLIEEILHGAET